jgi:regulator of protease activity HflC (stomatin/prohibitin superfamily)
MGEAFGWIADIIHWFASLIPRRCLVRKNYGGVKYVRGSKVKEMKPGIHWYWPFVTEIELFPTARQTQTLSAQALMTRDHQKTTVRGIVIYDIDNVQTALADNYDINDTIGDIAMSSIVESVTKRELDDLLLHVSNGVSDEITAACREELSEYGVRVYRTKIVDCSSCLVINTLGADASYITEEEEE